LFHFTDIFPGVNLSESLGGDGWTRLPLVWSYQRDSLQMAEHLNEPLCPLRVLACVMLQKEGVVVQKRHKVVPTGVLFFGSY